MRLSSTPIGRFLASTLLAGLAVAWSAPASAADTTSSGEAIYRQRCACCHGPAGEGTKEHYAKPLAGRKSVAQLARYVAKNMPEDRPGTCVGEEAERVAAYIHDAFYSEAARARNRPPRVELARLTVRQYRNAVADLVGTFRDAGRWDGERGLRGEYFKLRGPWGATGIDRRDPEVRFDFGTAGPDPKFDANQFSIRWSGSVLAPDTGTYEFVVRTEHAARLWVNDERRPLVDAWVKSGSDTDHRASLFLLGGRAYPLRLEFSKAKQGVDDSKDRKRKPPPVKASVALLWKRPGMADEVVPQRCLTPNRFPESFVPAAPFPADDRSVGYERGTSVSKAWDQATTDAAIETAAYVVANLRELAGVPDGAADRGVRLREFCRRFTERAFRRPLTDEQKRLYVDRQFERAPDPDTAVKRVVLLVLKSPRFLYREPGTGRDGYDVASRISFGLWDSLPDAELLQAAAQGRLATREQIARQAERMAGDLRAHAKLRAFFLQWLKVEDVPDLAKDPSRFPGFDRAVASDLRTSLELFLDDVLNGKESDFRRLLLADELYLNGRLARFYGTDLPADAPFRKDPAGGQERAGLLTHPYLMARFAYTAESSPIHRGVFLARSVLGLTLRPPPEAFAPLPPELHPGLTTRERVTLQTNSRACLTCHGMINPLGFTMEHFDAVGRYRDVEKGRPIDATGTYQTRGGGAVKFAGVRDLAAFLAGSEEVHAAFVEQLFHYLVKQPVRAFGAGTPAGLKKTFAAGGFNVRKLTIEITVASALGGEERTTEAKSTQRREGSDERGEKGRDAEAKRGGR